MYIHFHNTSKSNQILQRKLFKNVPWANCPRGDSYMEQTGMLVGNFELTPKGDHLGVAQAFCDP